MQESQSPSVAPATGVEFQQFFADINRVAIAAVEGARRLMEPLVEAVRAFNESETGQALARWLHSQREWAASPEGVAFRERMKVLSANMERLAHPEPPMLYLPAPVRPVVNVTVNVIRPDGGKGEPPKGSGGKIN